MLIQVTYTDEKYDFVKDFVLENLIATGAITKFRRSSGWVQVGVDPIRKERKVFDGDERRSLSS